MANITTSRCFKSLLLTLVSMTIGTTFFNVKSAQSNPINSEGKKVYADKVIDYTIGYSNNWDKFSGKADNSSRWQVYDPESALGAPNWTSEMTSQGDLEQWDKEIGTSLGKEGSLTVEFTNKALTGSGDEKVDLWIYEIGGVVETVDVEISPDNEIWYSIGRADRKNKQNDIGVGIDIDSRLSNVNVIASETLFPFVRVTDTGSNKYNNFKSGADIDAFQAIYNNPINTTSPGFSSNLVVSESVPEPSSIIGLLSLGIVAISRLIKPLQKSDSEKTV